MAYPAGGRRLHLMERLRTFAATTAGVAAAVRHFIMTAGEQSVELTAGDLAPDFELPGSDGKTYRLNDLAGRRVVLAWFPKAFTGG
jgi:hypothetical protein